METPIIDENCEARMTTKEASKSMSEYLADEFKKRDLDVSVLGLVSLLHELPTRPAPDATPADNNVAATVLAPETYYESKVDGQLFNDSVYHGCCYSLRLALGLKGRVSGCPEGFFVDPIEVSWDYGEIN